MFGGAWGEWLVFEVVSLAGGRVDSTEDHPAEHIEGGGEIGCLWPLVVDLSIHEVG